jgi:YggT family protein
MSFLAQILTLALNIYMWILILFVAISWLIAFGVLNTSNPQAQKLVELLRRVTDPILKPIQKFVPPIAGIDLSPIIALIFIQILNYLVWQLLG